MASQRIISIVTPSFNQAEFIGETIRSVIEQPGDFLIDYIIMDGGSQDGTTKILEEYEAAISQNGEAANVRGLTFYRGEVLKGNIACNGVSFRWKSEKDDGQSDAINKGIHLSVGEIVAFLNSDDTYFPGTLQQIAAFNWRNADFLYGKGMWIAKDGRELLAYPTYKPGKHNFYYQCTLCQPTVFMKRETFEKLGDFSTEFNVIFDFEYWMRAVFQGMKFRFIDEFLATSRFYVENKTYAQSDAQVSEIPVLKNKYYDSRPGSIDKLMLLKAKYTVHRNTVKQVNKLHQLINSPTRYVFG